MLDRKAKVLFVLPHMVGGGIERMRLIIAEQFMKEGMDCSLALRFDRGQLIESARALLPVYGLAPRGIHQFIPSLRSLIKRQQPTHVITAFPDVGVLTWCALKWAGSSACWIHSVHLTHDQVAARPGSFGRFRHLLERLAAKFVFQRADRIVAVSDGLLREVQGLKGKGGAPVVRIYNPVVPDEALESRNDSPGSCSRPFQIVAIGRLAREKGFDVLIDAMATVPYEWKLDIYGEGPERPDLERRIRESGLSGRIALKGFAPSPFEVLKSADLFVLASRYEGLGNVIVEAMACQCQIVATDCPVGPSEILESGRLGQIVPAGDALQLAQAIRVSMEGGFYVAREELSRRAAEFSREEGCRQWVELIRDSGPQFS